MQAEYDALSAEHEGLDDLPEEIEARLSDLEDRLAAFENTPPRFEPEEMAIAGAFISLDPQGRLQVERGYVRPEDELPVPAPAPVPTADAETGAGSDPHDPTVDQTVAAVPGVAGAVTPVQARTIAAASQAGPSISAHPADLVEEDEGIRPLSERLVAELTAHRTLGLRNALADDWDTAHLSVLHAFCLPLFYRRAGESCLEITVRSAGFLAQAPGLNDSAAARAIDARHEAWAQSLPAGGGATVAGVAGARPRQEAGAVRALRRPDGQRGGQPV